MYCVAKAASCNALRGCYKFTPFEKNAAKSDEV